MSSAQRELTRHDDVTRPPAMTVWIVDDDLGFVWWLGDIFSEVGCRALPALSCKDAVALMNEFGIEPSRTRDVIGQGQFRAQIIRRPNCSMRRKPRMPFLGAGALSGVPGRQVATFALPSQHWRACARSLGSRSPTCPARYRAPRKRQQWGDFWWVLR